jgi:histidyl-tRNA synthetase
MEDMLPQDSEWWRDIEDKARRELEFYGYSEIRTPILEDTAVFVRSIGETTDIVTKEMFTFSDRKERSLTMRPEGTAPIVRAYIEHSLGTLSPVTKLYYIGPMFRAERPQKGRLRQFHQIGVEVIGSPSPFADIEVLAQLHGMLKAFGLDGFVIKLNSLGCKDDKARFAESLKGYLADKQSRLCEDCKKRMEKNALRVLDCKNESCVQVIRNAPNIFDNLCAPCKDHFTRVKDGLKAVGVRFEETKNLVRGLDYYTGTVFEITHPGLGSQDAIGAGGRYDNLVKDMGGPSVGAVGYALGIERLIIALKGKAPGSGTAKVVYIATLGDAAKIRGQQLAEKIKDESVPRLVVLQDISEASLKSQMRSADKNGARFVVIMGEDEMSQGNAKLKDMKEKKEDVVAIDSVPGELRKRLC